MIKEASRSGRHIVEIEERFFGISHGEVTARVMKKWHFPEPIATAAQYHHHPEKAGPNDIFTWVVHAVDLLVHWNEAILAEDAATTQSLHQALLRPEMEVIFNIFGNWHADTLEQTRRQLNDLKTRQAGIINLFTG
jgi:HD-like signal output (HDOD) protein